MKEYVIFSQKYDINLAKLSNWFKTKRHIDVIAGDMTYEVNLSTFSFNNTQNIEKKSIFF